VFEPLPCLHLEISSKCTLRCPQCPRTHHEGRFPVRELELDAIRNIVSLDKTYFNVLLCGSQGDPIYHSEFHRVIELLQTLQGQPKIVVATNGSHRSAEWWRQTAALMGPRDVFTFGIDGLEDTNALYRRNSDWQSIMTAIEILKREGRCKVEWQWLLFRHNEHQLREGRNLARRLGVDRFFILESHRDAEMAAPTITLEEAIRRAQ